MPKSYSTFADLCYLLRDEWTKDELRSIVDAVRRDHAWERWQDILDSFEEEKRPNTFAPWVERIAAGIWHGQLSNNPQARFALEKALDISSLG